MNILLLVGADGWLGSSIKNEISTSFLKSLEIDVLLFHSKTSNNCLHEEISQDNILRRNIFGDFCRKKTFEELNEILQNLNTNKLYVICTLGIIHPKKYREFFDINFNAIKRIYKICSDFNLIKFTYISSNSPFGFNNSVKSFDEKSKYRPYGGYGKSKMMAEKFLLNLNRKNVITILRAPWFHGENMPLRQKKFLINASMGRFPVIAFGNNIRSIINVKDLAIASLMVTMHKRKFQIYWICENNKSISKIMKLIQYAAFKKGYTKGNLKNSFIIMPPGFSSFFFIADNMLQNFKIYNMYIHIFSELGQNIFADNSRYLKEFSDKHKLTNLEDSINEELEEAFK